MEPELTPLLHFKFITACYEFKATTQLKASNGFFGEETTPSDVIFSRGLKINPAETIWKSDDPIEFKQELLPPKFKIVPSFRTKFINRSYFAKLIVELEFGGKRFEAKSHWSPVTLLTNAVETL